MKRRSLLAVATLFCGCSVGDPSEAPPPSPSVATPSAAFVVAVAAAQPPAAATATAEAQVVAPPCPDDMVLAGRFCVDRYEAHLVELRPGGAASVHPHHLRPVAGASYVAANAKRVFPQGYISRLESEAACGVAGKRLCSRVEWQLACHGTASPPASAARRCNSGKEHLLALMFKQPFHYDAHFNSPELNKTAGFLAHTGEYEACESEIGAHDMVGNLHEWVSDTVSRALIVQLESDGVRRQWQPSQVGNGTFMGGFYSTSGEHGPGCLFTTIAHEPAYHDYSTGFRCCKAI